MAERFHAELNQQADSEGLWLRPRAEAMPRILELYGDLARQAASGRLLQNSHVDRDDYESAAMVALWKAAERFDPTVGAAFSTYATWRISGALIDVERDCDWIPSKTRARQKNGEIESLPMLFSLEQQDGREAVDAVAPQGDDRCRADELDALIAGSDPRAAGILRAAISFDLDHRRLARHLGVTPNRASDLYVAALESARLGTPFNPPTELRITEYRDRTGIIAIIDAVSRGIDTRRAIEAETGVSASSIPRLLDKMSDNGWGQWEQQRRGHSFAITIEPSGVGITL